MNFAKIGEFGSGSLVFGLAQVNFAGGAVERDPVAFLDRDLSCRPTVTVAVLRAR